MPLFQANIASIVLLFSGFNSETKSYSSLILSKGIKVISTLSKSYMHSCVYARNTDSLKLHDKPEIKDRGTPFDVNE